VPFYGIICFLVTDKLSVANKEVLLSPATMLSDRIVGTHREAMCRDRYPDSLAQLICIATSITLVRLNRQSPSCTVLYYKLPRLHGRTESLLVQHTVTLLNIFWSFLFHSTQSNSTPSYMIVIS
jgi:hypothetical protein